MSDSELIRLNLIAQNCLQKASTPPFLGLLPLENKCFIKSCKAIRSFLAGDIHLLKPLFAKFGYVAGWVVARSLHETYGSEDRAVYSHLEDTLGVKLDATGSARDLLFCGFRSVCHKLGIPNKNLTGMVGLYLLQAGVAKADLERLVDALFQQERAFGRVSCENTARVSAWEDDAMAFMPVGLTRPKAAINADETGYYARLYLRIREEGGQFQPDGRFEIHFAELVNKLGSSRVKAGRHSRALLPKPKLIWNGDGVALDVPKTDGRMQLWPLDGSSALRIRGGDKWLLPQPWPKKMRWKLRDEEGTLPFLESNFDVAVFDQTAGRFYAVVTPGGVSAREVDGTDIVLVSRRFFQIGELQAHQAGSDVFVAYTRLSNRSDTLFNMGGSTRLKAQAKRRISVFGAKIARGAQGDLYGPETMIAIETGMGRPEDRWVKFSVAGQHWAKLIRFIAEGTTELSVREVFADIDLPTGTGPTVLRVELMAPSEGETVAEKSSGLSQSIYLWPEYSTSPDSMIFKADSPASNFSQQDSHHIFQDDSGNICLDRQGGFAFAEAGFEIENAIVKFQFPWPDVTVSRVRDDGTINHLPFGSRLILGKTDRFDTIAISCPDDKAALTVMGRRENSPFYKGMKRNLALRNLLIPNANNSVVLHDARGNRCLFEIVPTLEPRGFDCRDRADQIAGTFTLPVPIDGLCLELQDIGGKCFAVEAALRFRPVKTKRPDWFHAELQGESALEVSFSLDLDRFPDDLSLARILVRPDGQETWQPLRNRCGDIYAIPAYSVRPTLGLVVDTNELERSFEILSRWLTECFASPCWPLIQDTIFRRWKRVGQRLCERPSGAGKVMRQANLPAPDDARRSWIPICHPLQIDSSIYEAEAAEFSWLSGSTEDKTKPLSSLAMLQSVLQSVRLRDAAFLHGVAYSGFSNFKEAQQKDVSLKGFSPEKYYRSLASPQVDFDPSAGCFWRGPPMLGPAHWRATHLSLQDCLEQTGLFDDGQDIDEERRLDLQRLLTAAARIGPIHPPTPKRAEDDDAPNSVDVWINTLLCNYARAARTGTVEDFYEKLEIDLSLTRSKILTTISLSLRLAPELFAFHMLVWQLAKERP